MTTQELREWHAKRLGYKYLTVAEDQENKDDPIGIRQDSWVRKIGFFPQVVPANAEGCLDDLIDDTFPSAWGWRRVITSQREMMTYVHPKYKVVQVPATGMEPHDTYAAIKACWEAEKQ